MKRTKTKRLPIEPKKVKVKTRKVKAAGRGKREEVPGTDPEILNIEEVCKLLRVSPRAIYHLVRDKKIPALKIGTKFRFYRKAILEALSRIG